VNAGLTGDGVLGYYKETLTNLYRRRCPVAKFRCIECKAEVEVDANESTKRCPKCFGRYLELMSGEMKRGKSWSAKSFSVK
jgi:DNA-directed RNA polymerase subunit RPC12/RpoP